MIFVTVGTNPTMHFDRLLEPMDRLAADLDEQVILQTGCSAFVPRNAEHFGFTTSEHIETLNRSARIIVSHAAAGSVITALRHRKPVIVVPRRHHLNEHIDDHQLELAHALEAEGRAITVYEPTVDALRQALQLAAEQGAAEDGARPLIQALRTQLRTWRKDAPLVYGDTSPRGDMSSPAPRKS